MCACVWRLHTFRRNNIYLSAREWPAKSYEIRQYPSLPVDLVVVVVAMAERGDSHGETEQSSDFAVHFRVMASTTASSPALKMYVSDAQHYIDTILNVGIV